MELGEGKREGELIGEWHVHDETQIPKKGVAAPNALPGQLVEMRARHPGEVARVLPQVVGLQPVAHLAVLPGLDRFGGNLGGQVSLEGRGEPEEAGCGRRWGHREDRGELKGGGSVERGPERQLLGRGNVTVVVDSGAGWRTGGTAT